MKSFFVQMMQHLKLLKLGILIVYVNFKRILYYIKEVTESLNGLVHLLSNRDGMSMIILYNLNSINFFYFAFFVEYVVAESVVVIKKLAKLLDFITVAASILWLIGEYNEKVPKIAPDVLRKIAKSFVDEVTFNFFVFVYIFTVIFYSKTPLNYKY